MRVTSVSSNLFTSVLLMLSCIESERESYCVNISENSLFGISGKYIIR